MENISNKQIADMRLVELEAEIQSIVDRYETEDPEEPLSDDLGFRKRADERSLIVGDTTAWKETYSDEYNRLKDVLEWQAQPSLFD